MRKILIFTPLMILFVIFANHKQHIIVMLINFTFQNFRSFRDEKTLSMEASSITELRESVIHKNSHDLLPVAVMYGANSSGKSNVLHALRTMRDMILTSVKLNPEDSLSFDPFRLDLQSSENPTSFEIQILQNDITYRYGFDYDQIQIHKEWLYEKENGKREYNLFLRVNNDFAISKSRFPEGIGKENSTPKNRLFLSLVAQLNGIKSNTILNWFGNCNYLSGVSGEGYGGFTLQMFHQHLDGYQEALNFFRHTQLGFDDLLVRKIDISDEMLKKNLPYPPGAIKDEFLNQVKQENVFVETETIHTIYDADGQAITQQGFSETKMESEGTRKIIELSGPLFNSLKEGKVLIIDELDAKLHPLLTLSIVQLFMDPSTNPKGAQLIFTTHDTNLLNLEYLRRDQIWFTEKDRTDSSDLYSLVEFRENGILVRKDRNIQKDYINGRYGAIPFMK